MFLGGSGSTDGFAFLVRPIQTEDLPLGDRRSGTAHARRPRGAGRDHGLGQRRSVLRFVCVSPSRKTKKKVPPWGGGSPERPPRPPGGGGGGTRARKKGECFP